MDPASYFTHFPASSASFASLLSTAAADEEAGDGIADPQIGPLRDGPKAMMVAAALVVEGFFCVSVGINLDAPLICTMLH